MNKKTGVVCHGSFRFCGLSVFFAGSGAIRSCFSEGGDPLHFFPTRQGTALLFILRRINSFDNVQGKMPDGGFVI